MTLVFSGREIRVAAAKGMQVAVGVNEIAVDPADPVVEVEPCFPGCLIAPGRLKVDLTPATQAVRFWVTPLTSGELKDACVRVYYRGRVVETLATPDAGGEADVGAGVPRRRAGVAAAQALGQRYGWSPMEELMDGFPAVGRLFAAVGATAGALIVGAAVCGVGAVLYRLTRPVEANQDEVPALA